MEEVVAQLQALTAKMQQLEEIEKARQLSQNLAESSPPSKGKEKFFASRRPNRHGF